MSDADVDKPWLTDPDYGVLPCEMVFRAIRDGVEPLTRYSEGDHKESKTADINQVYWSRELYHDGEYMTVNVTIRCDNPAPLSIPVQR